MSYIGRFAPSPTGPLHFGSLLAALASFLDARAHQGEWLLRIEDLDPPREQAGVKDQFPDILEAFGLYWDGELSFQSERLDHYQDALQQLISQHHAYYCNCSRKQIIERCDNIVYDRHCLNNPPKDQQGCAVRVKSMDSLISFRDMIQGPMAYNLNSTGDFVVFRRDGLFAYQLAVVVDDYLQGITHVVRGSDLLDETARQIHLQQLLGYPTPSYAHIPVATNAQGQKLSKQTFAKALNLADPEQELLKALQFLNLQPPKDLSCKSRHEILNWAIEEWDINKLPKTMGIALGDN
ncbi:tRNA glutamyl-Q(34) synthetase GluQRS [Neptuniibacter caesariensis]|uniref:Glutamyl-Q tRNA(Asp) synthetase n=1 Tax=Neptuniibacter caesariensis TaxID=207954 RepID=A0A7U8C288_NEPCE|nr:tRNA glutamyl-Q(34) synthetase GluQRS [Neptuniibacter caesariensis]EAR59864.1 putative glutamyl t-RNA synthetase [Oceanospirillum sp. MED92] [Neptuniibacter caesariensis]